MHKEELYRKISNIPLRLRMRFYTIFNRWKFKMSGVVLGKNARIRNKIYLKITPPELQKFIVGNDFLFSSGDGINPLGKNIIGEIFINKNGKIVIGNNVQMSNTVLWSDNLIQIGNNVKLGSDVIILDTDAHNVDYKARRWHETDQANVISKPIFIEDDVLVGTRSIILKGVTIGARTIIGSGSIVTKSIPADCIAAGNPCKVIRQRKNETSEDNSCNGVL